jgi:glyoxylase-like metal-dependent hydrolase (beta-lactamase superfamily II)
VKIHHLNLCTMCPYGMPDLVCHALLVESSDGLVLVDTGMGLADVRSPRQRLGAGFVTIFRIRLRDEDTAIRQIERLGFEGSDVRHVVVTHLDVDHAGGIADFPDATIHVHRAEHAAATASATMRERTRYRKVHFASNPKWELHEAGGDRWFGFESVRVVADDVALIPLFGHSRGHCAVAVRAPAGSGAEWYLHCGDAYFWHRELDEPPSCPPGLVAFQHLAAIDDGARIANAARLRVLRREAGDRIRMFCAHSRKEFTESRT